MALWWRMLVAGAALGLVGCAAGAGAGPAVPSGAAQPAAGYAHRASTSDVVLYWNCVRPDPGLLRLEGIAQNPWGDKPIVSLRFELVSVDAQEHGVSEARAEARDAQLAPNQSTPFGLDLRTSGREVRFDLYFQYYLTPNELEGRLAGAPVPLPRLRADTTRNLIRDVCGESQHLAR